MRVFKEEQAFRQWWILLILGITLIGTSFPLFRSYENSDLSISGFIGFGLVLLVLILFLTLRLHTKIDSNGIKTSFEPLTFFRKEYKWNEISKCYVRKYAPIREYGGWGIRGSGKSKAYNVSGNMGIQIITKDQKKFLIGTNKPEEAKRVLERYQDKL
ncbi:hypothetical protein [Christiangramia sediminis]|uniref:Uncharacterized protein n=1 Tax=Christiangramia sediminis TaxID=2881336 RepID=A0A9X1LIE7_9FLAO|nr:hypothetical protein [Christiangramia sediminis]MCB7480915.1 hypothetical protein [Christiangramia sediminis]